jgi:hypothetical protein
MSRRVLAAAAEAVCVLQIKSKSTGRQQATRFARGVAQARDPQPLSAHSPVARKEQCTASVARAGVCHGRATSTHLHVQAMRVIGVGPIVKVAIGRSTSIRLVGNCGQLRRGPDPSKTTVSTLGE